MQCLKCGRKIQDDQVFCEGCLLAMQAYPVKPGTAIQLPSRQKNQEEKKKTAKRKPLSPAEQNVQLRVANRRLRTVAVVLLLLLCATAAALGYMIMKRPDVLNLVR